MASNINFLFTFCSWTSDNLIFQEADTNIKLILAKLPMCEPFISVTRFGKILLLGCNFKSLQQFLDAFSIFDNILDLLWQILNTIGEIFIVVKGQKLKN